MSKKTLSFSAYSRYHICPFYYKTHDIDKIRPTIVSNNLVIGAAFDEGVNVITESGGDGYKNFRKKLYDSIKGETVQWEKLDFDYELLTDQEMDKLSQKVKKLGYKGDDIRVLVDSLLQKFEAGQRVSEKQIRALNLIAFECQCAKGKLMLEAYEKQILPLFKEVLEVQKWTKRGLLDLKVKLQDHGVAIIDIKSTRKPYLDDAVRTSPQLAIYTEDEGVDVAGFVTFNKIIKKNRIKVCKKCSHNGGNTTAKTCNKGEKKDRCHGEWDESISPEVVTQFLIDKIPKRLKGMTTKALNDTEKLIQAGCFPRNLGACNYVFGKKCQYYDYCHSGSKKGLKKND